MIKILFLCHGNICRSPMAEYVMKKMIQEAELGDFISVTSRALHRDELGNGVYPPARKLLNAAGIDCSAHHATLMKVGDYDDYDYIIVMDEANIRDVMRISSGDPDGKVYKLMQFEIADEKALAGEFVTVLEINEAPDVADPWYTRNFDTTWREINAGCMALLYKIALDLFPHSEAPISNEQMRAADAYTIKNFVSGEELMRRAGFAIADEIMKRKLVTSDSMIGIICGKGNNGGDGLVCAERLATFDYNIEIIKIEDVPTRTAAYDFSKYDLIVDCIFGTGFHGEVREPYRSIIEKVNAWRAEDPGHIVVSADINSGLNGNTGEGGDTCADNAECGFIISDLTIAIGSYKHGHFLGLATEAMKDKVCVDIGIVIPSTHT